MARTSESAKDDDDKFDVEDVESGLKDLFNLTPDILKKECKVDFKSSWPNIATPLEKLQKMFDSFETEAAQHFKEPEGEKYRGRVAENCQKSEPFKKERVNVIQAALPCAKEQRVTELVKISKQKISC